MPRHAIDRWADTRLFRLALLLAALAVMPVLFMGIATTVFGGADMLLGRSSSRVELEHAAFALLSIGGVLGFVGYLRAHWGIKDPRRHNLTATFVFLTAGVLAALAVAGFVVVAVVESSLEPWGSYVWLLLGALFAAANLVWAFSGIAWMQRLLQRYAENTGSVFDGLPVVLLLVATALATAAAVTTITL